MSVTAAQGFRAAGVRAGLKASGKPDLALVVNGLPVATLELKPTSRGASPTRSHSPSGIARSRTLSPARSSHPTGGEKTDPLDRGCVPPVGQGRRRLSSRCAENAEPADRASAPGSVISTHGPPRTPETVR